MKIHGGIEVRPGEIWSVGCEDAKARAKWCLRVALDEELDGKAAILSFAQHAGRAERTGWPQARYYGEEGETVGEMLSYNAVYDINPFAVGAKRPEPKRAFASRLERIVRLLELRPHLDKPVIALSNGETRRALLARALATGPSLLVLDDPAAGMDPKRREKLKDIVKALANRGIAVLMACRHDDELPDSVAGRIEPAGGVWTARRGWKPTGAVSKKAVAKNSGKSAKPTDPEPARSGSAAKPVVEIRDLTLEYDGRMLFDHFSWTVRKGERWILRGPNGSGKTTLFALVTGDSPYAYAADGTVLGVRREVGVPLDRIRRRIGVASPEMQAYLGLSPERQLADAMKGRPALLLLDEPFMNMDEPQVAKARARIASYLNAHSDVTAIMICHREDEAPNGFDRVMELQG